MCSSMPRSATSSSSSSQPAAQAAALTYATGAASATTMACMRRTGSARTTSGSRTAIRGATRTRIETFETFDSMLSPLSSMLLRVPWSLQLFA